MPAFAWPLLHLALVATDVVFRRQRTELPGGGVLYVSRGIGMERLEAPRLRFWCRPELAILELGGG